MNTVRKGAVRCITFKEGNTWYGVALEFNLVVESEDKDVVNFNLQEAIRGYIEAQKKIKGSRVSPLNQKADPEYEELWNRLVENKPIRSPITVSNFGITRINA
ncbi:hypothetical protein A3D62_01030 [Candidatus Kaiserbacteria bacterium RIFCSPHIGHO2_02_FULL_49_11]|uniref:HicB-like antitoxin of toxin-antitoxin system domain-containing protein n=1 Tax=Candidatus Kaiserbacteria bacterium RIFCSPHIGHO2_02_FULL_49_11 TaxID=1798489 RepID=A0A1F6D0Y6_9BACT|nr:MAG: hypothetical protein A3D62_01030 [Candidatus Kaiserbacteria bacterium RIFCSPHIGHO2_02_FULL_49_11]